MAHLQSRFENHRTGCNVSPGVQLRDLVQNPMKASDIETHLYKLPFVTFFPPFWLDISVIWWRNMQPFSNDFSNFCANIIPCVLLTISYKCWLKYYNFTDKHLLQTTVMYVNKAVLKHREQNVPLLSALYTHFESDSPILLENVISNKHQKYAAPELLLLIF